MKKIILVSALTSLFLFSPIAAGADEAELLRKMNEIADSQKQIIETLEHLKSELQIVKIRVSSR